MLKKEDIEHLATLARISVSEEEKEAFALQLDSVLGYVSELNKVVTLEESTPKAGELRNVMRPDENPNPGGEFTDTILANAPHKEGEYFKVSQIM
jgi:aspartyl-tRNA(Asn)/glutamyl-tRNA(Gln) amidotransferase subunit C